MLNTGTVIGVVITGILAVIAVKIFVDVNKSVQVVNYYGANTNSAIPIMDVVPTVIAAVAIIMIVMAFGLVGGGER